MNKKTPSLFLLIIIFLQANQLIGLCQSENDIRSALFWEISGNELESPSYIYGTIHVMPKDEFKVFPSAENKLKESDLLVMEINMDVPLKTKIEWAKKMMLPADSTLQDYLSSDSYTKLKSFTIDSLGISKKKFERFTRLKPFAFYSALIPQIIDEKIEGYDMHFMKIAKKEDIPIAELENFDFQMGIFDSIRYEDQLELFFEDFSHPAKDFDELLDIYKAQDIHKMAKMFDSGSDYEQFEYELITNRNQNWISKIEQFIQDNKTFIAVGAGHLGGDKGIIQLLMHEGYILTPLSLE